jgi:glutathione S-transferase
MESSMIVVHHLNNSRSQRMLWHFAEGSAMPPLVMKLVFDRVETEKMPFFARPIARAIARKVKSSYVMPQIQRQLDYLEAELGESEWFAGAEFSAADIMLSFVLEAAASRGGMDEQYPKLRQFLSRIHARPAYRRAVERGGEYDYAR